MKVTRTFTVEQRGVGKPDYTRDVFKSIQRAGIELEYGQSLKFFGKIFTPKVSVFAWIAPILAPGATAHLIDMETGLDMPWTLPAGYTCSEVQDSLGFKEDAECWIYVSLPPLPGLQPGMQLSVHGGGEEVYRNRVIPFSTTLFDPMGATAHEIDIDVTNNGLGNLEGSLAVTAIMEEVGTEPLPTVKTVRCKHCGHQWVVPLNSTNLICPKCGKLTVVYDLSSFRGTR